MLKKTHLIPCALGGLLAASFPLTSLVARPAFAQKTTVTSATTKSPVRHNLNSVRGLTAHIAELKQKQKASKGEKSEGTGIYEERLARLRERAFPSDQMDSMAVLRGIAQRDQLPRAIPQRVLWARPTLNAGGNPAAAWEFIGPKNLSVPYTTYYGPINSALTGRVSGIAFHPTDPKTIYIATPVAGVHKSVDGGTSWTAVGDSFPIPFTSCVAVNPHNPKIVYAGLGDHDYGIDASGWWFGGGYNARQFGGIMRSTDSGATWTKTMGYVVGSAVNSLATDPDTPGLVLAAYAGGTNASIYRSVDYGLNWSVKPTTKTLITYAEDIEIGERDASGKRAYYLVGSQNKLYRSTDKGVSWILVTGVGGSGRIQIAASKVDANTLYVASTSDRKIRKGVRSTVSGGWTWTDITGNFPQNYGPGSNWGQSFYDFHMSAAAHTINGTLQDTLYLGLITIAASPGANGTWIDIGRTGSSAARTHNDSHSFGIFPGNSNIMAVGNDGGIYGLTFTPPAGAPVLNSWTFATRWNSVIGITAFHDADFHPTNPSVMLGGTQDNATPASLGDINNWRNPGAGDGFGCAINPSNPAIQFLTVQGGVVVRTASAWASSADITPAYNNESPGFFTWVGIDPTAPGHFYLGTQYLWRFNETTQAWEGHLGTTKLSNDQIRTITVAPSDNKRLYVGTTDGQFWVSKDQGANWTAVAGLPNRAFTSIFVNPIDPDHLRVAVGGTGTGHLYESFNGGVTFKNLSGTGATALPDVPANAVTADASSIWVGTDVGVFSSIDGGSTWQNATQALGLPNCEVSALKMVPGTGYLMAATYGRGMWRLPRTIDTNWQLGNPFGTGTIVIANASLGLANGLPVVSLTLQNTGDGNANNVTVTTAKLLIGTDPSRDSTSIPLNVGMITNGTQKVAALSYPATTQPLGSQATLKVVGTYIRTKDQTLQTFSSNFKIRLQ